MCVLPVPGAPYSSTPRLRCWPLASSRRECAGDAEHLPLDVREQLGGQHELLSCVTDGLGQERSAACCRSPGPSMSGPKLITCPRNTERSCASVRISRSTAAGPVAGWCR